MQLNSPSPGRGLEMKQEGVLWGTWLSMETRHHIHHPHTLDKHHLPISFSSKMETINGASMHINKLAHDSPDIPAWPGFLPV